MTPYGTSKTKNCEPASAITITNGTFTATLADSSITTFVADIVSDVETGSAIPQTFELSQNYPNPFNPETEIRYQTPEVSQVTLTVYDVLGREVATLVNEQLPAGIHRATWDAGGFPSGMYLYRLTANGFVETKKLILLK